MTWYLAPSLSALRSEADRLYPRRSRASDGTIGDSAHSARTSDHNPKPDGHGGMVVDALDLTNDPDAGLDVHRWIRERCAARDPRIKYAISAGEIWTPERGWVTYTGSSPHKLHGHISVKATEPARTDCSPWFTVTPQEVARMFDTHRFVELGTPKVDAANRFAFYSWDPATSAVYAWNSAPGPVLSAEGQRKIREAGGIRHLFHTAEGLVAVVGNPGQESSWTTWAFWTLGEGDRT